MTSQWGSWGFSQRPCLNTEGGERSRRTTGINFGSPDSCAYICVHIYIYMYTYTHEHIRAQHREPGPEVNEDLQKFGLEIYYIICVCGCVCAHTHIHAMVHVCVRGPYHVNLGIKLRSLLLEGLSLPTEPSCQLPSFDLFNLFNLFVFEIRPPVAQADSGPAVQPRMTLHHMTKLFPGERYPLTPVRDPNLLSQCTLSGSLMREGLATQGSRNNSETAAS